jgi:hypothetical protein
VQRPGPFSDEGRPTHRVSNGCIAFLTRRLAGTPPTPNELGSSRPSPVCPIRLSMSMPYDCFLSYASKDHAEAEAVHARLTAAGFNVWFDKRVSSRATTGARRLNRVAKPAASCCRC